MDLMDGLATYQIIKTGFAIFILVIFLLISVNLFFYNMNQNYQSSTICNVTSSIDGSFTQTLTYTVNNKVYNKIVQPAINVHNNIATKNYQYPEGLCTIYYPQNNPDAYSLNINPTTASQIIAGILLVIVIFASLWFMFLRSNKNVAGVFGGIGASRDILSIFRGYNN
jgi:ATP-dependent Zn protease